MISINRTCRIRSRLCFLMIVLLLVLAAVGCASPDPTTEPTEPTTAEDAVYEKLESVVREIRDRESYHFKFYLTLDHPVDQDPTANENYTQGWISGADMYVEQAYQGPVTPSFVRYNGAIYSHFGDDIWMQVTGSNVTTDYYRITMPSLQDHTMTWNETEDHLDITFVDNNDPDSGVLFRMDPDGRLLWYTQYLLAPVTNTETGETFNAPMYTVMTYPDMDAEAIRQHLDTVVPPLIADMEFYDPAAEPST